MAASAAGRALCDGVVAEWLALDRLGYPPISRKDLELEAQKIREQYSLSDLKVCAETFKHVRKIKDQRSTR